MQGQDSDRTGPDAVQSNGNKADQGQFKKEIEYIQGRIDLDIGRTRIGQGGVQIGAEQRRARA